MDVLLRTIAIIVEVLILAAITYAVFHGVKLTSSDLGIGPKYGKAVLLALLAVGLIVLIFFIAHLTTFYPAV